MSKCVETCLSETLGEDVARNEREAFVAEFGYVD
jgi:hypothetical protein